MSSRRTPSTDLLRGVRRWQRGFAGLFSVSRRGVRESGGRGLFHATRRTARRRDRAHASQRGLRLQGRYDQHAGAVSAAYRDRLRRSPSLVVLAFTDAAAVCRRAKSRAPHAIAPGELGNGAAYRRGFALSVRDARDERLRAAVASEPKERPTRTSRPASIRPAPV